MHKKETVLKYRERITKAVDEIFNLAVKNQETLDDIVCFLCNGVTESGYNMFGPGDRGITDRYQSEFLIDFMNTSEEEEAYAHLESEEDKKRLQRYSTNIELMIYSHLWESDVSLGNLKHLANFIEGQQYDWRLQIPRDNKWEFITKTVRGVFEKYDLDISNIIKETYNSQLRNAFAHSQYGLFENTAIRLYNFQDKSYQFAAITFEDWEERFIKTVDMFVAISNKKYELLEEYSKSKPILRIWVPVRYPSWYRRRMIYWDRYAGYYGFNKHALEII